MTPLRRHDRAAEPADPDSADYSPGWNTPAKFNFARDVVEPLAGDQTRRALTVVGVEGVIERFTFWEIAKAAAGWASVFVERGLAPGDRVMIMLGRRPGLHGAVIGALKAGLIAVPCRTTLTADEVAARARHCGAALIVADAATRTTIEQATGKLDEPPAALLMESETQLLGDRPLVAATHDTSHDDPALIFYTSGTFGSPRAVVHTHAHTFSIGAQTEHWLGARPGDVVWSTAPAGEPHAVWHGLLGPWSVGAEILTHAAPFDPTERFELIERLGATVLCQPASEYRAMAKLDELELIGLGRLRHAVSTGTPLSPETLRAFQEAFDLTIREGYSQTEVGTIIANLPGVAVRPGSMGRPLPGHDVGLIDDHGNPVPPNTEGEIAIRGRPPTLFAGYWKDAGGRRAPFRQGWYITGDRATRDTDGYFWFVGRADDLIVGPNYRISPADVESALLAHPDVAEAAVIGKPDAESGQVVKAFVVLSPGCPDEEGMVERLQEHVRDSAAPYLQPREISVVTELPRTSSGKISRAALHSFEHAGAAQEPADPDPYPDAGRTESTEEPPRAVPLELDERELMISTLMSRLRENEEQRRVDETQTRRLSTALLPLFSPYTESNPERERIDQPDPHVDDADDLERNVAHPQLVTRISQYVVRPKDESEYETERPSSQ